MKHALFLALLLLLSGCTASEKKAAPERISPAPDYFGILPSVAILSPADGQVIQGTSVTVMVKVTNFALKEPGGANKAGEGHIHYSIDGRLLSMSSFDAAFLGGIPRGSHVLEVELVSSDHSSLSPKISAKINFKSESQLDKWEEGEKLGY